MVVVVKTTSRISNTLYYNENVLKLKVAELIHSTGVTGNTEKRYFNYKIMHLQKLAQLNDRAKLNSVHISLNFDPSEKIIVTLSRELGKKYI